jgi:uncharacterized membrane protein YkoI
MLLVMLLLLRIVGTIVIVAMLLGGVRDAVADDEQRDHDLARKALLEGRIRPLTEITEVVRSKVPGEILAVQIDIDDQKHRFVYEFDIITPEGKLREVDVDAATATILKIEEDE